MYNKAIIQSIGQRKIVAHKQILEQPKLNNSEDVKYLSLCQNRPRTSRKKTKTKKDWKIIVLIDLAVLQSVTLLVCGTYLQWLSEEKTFLQQCLNYKLELTVNFI